MVKLGTQDGLIFKTAITENDFADAKKLFLEYANSLDFDLYFQGFSNELETLQSQYNSPTGSLIIAYTDDSAVGCIGLRQFSQDIAELKRMYVKPTFRGRKIGYTLLESILYLAKQLGYKKIRLDSLSNMKEAILLYNSFGFIVIEPYRYNPLEGAIFMEKQL